MKPNIRLHVDRSTGHGCFPPTVPAQASPNVFTNSIAEVRVGDRYVPHCCPHHGCHTGKAATGASRTYTNGRPTHIKTGAISCGDVANHGSSNTLSG